MSRDINLRYQCEGVTGGGVVIITPPPPLQAFFLLRKQPTIFRWRKLASTLRLTQCDPPLKNYGYTPACVGKIALISNYQGFKFLPKREARIPTDVEDWQGLQTTTLKNLGRVLPFKVVVCCPCS